MSKQQSAAPNLSPQKKLLFTLVLFSIPLLFFILLEGFLRIINYGPNLSLFTKRMIGGREYLIMNPSVKSRYFNQVDFSPTTSPEYFLMPKPAGTFRIFCLGGSTTVGYPYWYNASFSSFLRDRLKTTFPEKPVEVINLGMTATNSFTVLDFARDLVEYEPDLFIVYDGHNEFYGALGVASNESVGSSRFATMLYLNLIHFRTFFLLRDGINIVSGWFGTSDASVSRAGTMMEQMAIGQYIDYMDSRYQKAFNAFNANLDALRSLCAEHSIPLLLGTQVSNLKDQPPFVSTDHSAWPAPQRERFSMLLQASEDLLRQSQVSSAADSLRMLLQYDSLSASAWYGLGRAYEALGYFDSARASYIRARDYDRLRFRMSSDFNEALLGLHALPAVGTADMELAFARSSPHGLIGRELTTEHLHPNARGFFLMAKEYARLMKEMGLFASQQEWATRDTVSDASLWDNRPVTTVDELIAERRTEVLTSGWPFKDQFPVVDAVDPTDTLRYIAEQATKGIWDWKQVHESAADFYVKRGELPHAEREYRTIVSQIPLDVSGYLHLARIQLDRNQIGMARITLMTSLRIQETPLAFRALGDIALRSGRAGDAVTHYERLSQFPQSPKERDENGYLLSLAYLQSNNPDAAVLLLKRLLRDNPANTQANSLLKRINEVRNSSSPR